MEDAYYGDFNGFLNLSEFWGELTLWWSQANLLKYVLGDE